MRLRQSSAPDPAEGAHSAPADSLAGFGAEEWERAKDGKGMKGEEKGEKWRGEGNGIYGELYHWLYRGIDAPDSQTKQITTTTCQHYLTYVE